MSEILKHAIEQAKMLNLDIKNQKEASVYKRQEAVKFPPFPEYTVTKEIYRIFADAKALIMRELNIYGSNNPQNEIKKVPEGVEVETAFAHADDIHGETPKNEYADDFRKHIQLFSIFDYTVVHDKFNLASMTQAELNLYKVCAAESEFVSENMAALSYSIAVVNKIKTAVDALAMGRISDAITVLKTAKKGSPNNRSLAFMLSQIYYFKAQVNGKEYLPEARGEAKKSCLYSEDCHEIRLRQYRYAYVLHECHYDAKKAINLMREFYLLNPESLTEAHGLSVHEGVHFKTWVLLSTLDSDLLGTFEIDSLQTIATTSTCGVNFYLNVMRPQVLHRLTNSKDMLIAKMMRVEELIFKAHQNYHEIIDDIQQNYDENLKLQPQSNYDWTLENKYVSLLLKAAPIPSFDEIYLHTSLDAKRHSQEAYPNRAMAAMGLPNVNYWQVWSFAITAVEGRGGSRTLPVKRVVAQAELFRTFDRILKGMEELEKEIVPEEKWQLIEAYMPAYEYRIFPYVSAGPEAFQAPSNPYYNNLYKAWVRTKPANALPSVILKEYAEQGNFLDSDEVIAAFEGAYRVLLDGVHGLKARAKEALKICLKEKKEREAGSSGSLLGDGHIAEFWWLYALVVPLAFLAFYVIFGSGGSGGGFFTLLIIVLLAAGLGYAIFTLSGTPSGQVEGELSDEEKSDHSENKE